MANDDTDAVPDRAAWWPAIEQAWQGFPIDRDAVDEALDRIAAESGPPSREQACVVALAVACAAGHPRAVRAFEDRYFAAAERAAAGVAGETEAQEVMQRVRERLFLAQDGAPARVLQAAGRGDMGKFVRVAAVRLALNARREQTRRDHRHESAGLDALLDDPELSTVKGSLRTTLKLAFEDAVATLTSQQRNLLKHHLVDHLSIDQLAVRYGVHRATAARWLAAARVELAERTQAELRARVADDREAAAAFELAHSRLELSLTRVLAGT